MMAVSYEELMEKKLDRIDDRRDKPVSYTHLDVYKRQSIHRGGGDDF